MDDAFRLGQMKAAVRAALPDGAGDFTITSVARAALECAKSWERSETILICGDRDGPCPNGPSCDKPCRNYPG